jgi:hypothetical protein
MEYASWIVGYRLEALALRLASASDAMGARIAPV